MYGYISQESIQLNKREHYIEKILRKLSIGIKAFYSQILSGERRILSGKRRKHPKILITMAEGSNTGYVPKFLGHYDHWAELMKTCFVPRSSGMLWKMATQ